MQILSAASQHRGVSLWPRLALMACTVLLFTFLTASRLSSSSSAHGGRPVPLPAGLIFVVNTTADGSDVAPGDGQCDSNIGLPGEQCTLRAAIMEANAHAGDDAIHFEIPASDPGCSGGQCRIKYSTALPDISTNIEFDGPGAKRLLISPTGGVRSFLVISGATVMFSGLTVSNGFGDLGGNISNAGTGTVTILNSDIEIGVANVGGNVYNHTTGTINIINSRIGGGTAVFGGGVFNNNIAGTINITNSTLDSNHSNGTTPGGAINNPNGGTVNVSNCTITHNTADKGGGIGGSARVKSTIIAGNMGTSGNPDVAGTLTSSGFNLIGIKDGSTGFTAATDQTGTAAAPIDPHFGANDNTGQTSVPSLPCQSSAIDQGTSSSLSAGTLTTDQRGTGFARVFDQTTVANAAGGDGADIGAYERLRPCNQNLQFTVNSTGDEIDANPGDLVCATAANKCTLRAALHELLTLSTDNTATSATINFAIPANDPGFDPATGRSTISVAQDLPTVATNNIQIIGPGADLLSVRNTGTANILSFINLGVTSISGMTLQNAKSRAIFASNNGGTMNLTNCVFNGNSADAFGGALLKIGGALNITNCTFTGNATTGDPRFSTGGAVWLTGVNVNVSGCI